MAAARLRGVRRPGDRLFGADGLLDGRPCPCIEGWVCDDDRASCVRALGDAGGDSATNGGAEPDGGAMAEPPRVSTECWRTPDVCDWSGPAGFEFVAGASDVIGGLSISANPGFSPDGCELFFDLGSEVRFARHADAGAPFVDQGAIAGVEQAGSVEPDRLQLFFGSDRGGTSYTIWRAQRSDPADPWSGVVESAALSLPGINNWDGMLAPHGLRFYWSPVIVGGDQDIPSGAADPLYLAYRAL